MTTGDSLWHDLSTNNQIIADSFQTLHLLATTSRELYLTSLAQCASESRDALNALDGSVEASISNPVSTQLRHLISLIKASFQVSAIP